MYEVIDLYLITLHKETQTVMNTANQSSSTGQVDSFLPTIFYEQKMLSNQKAVGVNTMENQKKNFRKSYPWENSVQWKW